MNSLALTDGGTISFDWADDEVDDDLTISSSGSVNSLALTDGGTISFDWVDDEVDNALTISGGAISSSAITLSTTANTASGGIYYNSTNDRILVYDGTAVDSFYSGAHTTDTNAETICTGSSYLDGDGDCRALPSGSGSAGRVAYWTNADSIGSDSQLYWDSANNRLGIGGAAGWPLHVKISNTYTNPDQVGYTFLVEAVGDVLFSTTQNYMTNILASIFAESAIISDYRFVIVSDERMKNMEGVSDSATDLETLLNLEVVDYQYVDQLQHGTTTHKKVIAQQIEEYYPIAVSQITDVVPDIYEPADSITFLGANIVRVNFTEHSLQDGDRVRVILEKYGTGEEEWRVLERDEEIYDITNVTSNSFEIEIENENIDDSWTAFVYGREVDDNRVVDYDSLTTLNM